MRADRIEIAQGDGPERSGGRECGIAEDVLADLFGIAVGRGGRFARVGFLDGERVRFAVDGRGRGEDECFDAVSERRVEDGHERADIVAVVEEGLLDRFTDGLECGEMDDPVDLFSQENGFDEIRIGAVAHVCLRSGSEYRLESVEYRLPRVAEIIENDRHMSGLRELDDRMRPDISGSSSDKYVHSISVIEANDEIPDTVEHDECHDAEDDGVVEATKLLGDAEAEVPEDKEEWEQNRDKISWLDAVYDRTSNRRERDVERGRDEDDRCKKCDDYREPRQVRGFLVILAPVREGDDCHDREEYLEALKAAKIGEEGRESTSVHRIQVTLEEVEQDSGIGDRIGEDEMHLFRCVDAGSSTTVTVPRSV